MTSPPSISETRAMTTTITPTLCTICTKPFTIDQHDQAMRGMHDGCAVVLGDGAAFTVEREFYCGTCADFRDVRENQQDIVCEACDSILATFRNREIHATTPTGAPHV